MRSPGAVMRRIRGQVTFASATSMLAIFVALGGTGYAAITVAANGVGSKQIKRNAVGGQEIRKNAVRSGEARNGALRLADFRAGTILPGPQGPAGLQGPQGPQGERGAIESVTAQFEQAAADLADGASASYNAFCPAGQLALAGGFRGDFDDSEATNVTSSRPSMSPGNTEPPLDDGTFSGWRITVVNLPGGVTTGIRPEVWVACVTP